MWARFVEHRKRPHAPGVWVIYFSLAALPLFGIGQRFIPAENLEARRYAFKLLCIYTASGLGLLMTTSFLGLRRYLRQRRLEMPLEMASVWLTVGSLMIAALLFVCWLLPRPNAEYSITHVPFQVSSPSNLEASRHGWGSEGAQDKPHRAELAAPATKEQEGRPGGTESEGRSGEGKPQAGEGQGKSPGGQQGDGNEPGGQAGEGKSSGGPSAGEGKSGKQSSGSQVGGKQGSQDQNTGQQQGQRQADGSKQGQPDRASSPRHRKADERVAGMIVAAKTNRIPGIRNPRPERPSRLARTRTPNRHQTRSRVIRPAAQNRRNPRPTTTLSSRKSIPARPPNPARPRRSLRPGCPVRRKC